MDPNFDFGESDENSSNIGLAAFFKPHQSDYIQFSLPLYENYIPERYKDLPKEILQKRNQLLYLCIAQIFASVIGMFYIIFRRSYIYLIINLLTLSLAFSGVYGSVNVHLLYLLLHCLFTTSITGGFFIYQIFDFFIVEDTSFGDKKRINDNIILFIFSLPYIFDFYVGLYNYVFLKNVTEFNKAKEDSAKCDIEKITSKFTDFEIQDHLLKNENRCVICLDQVRNTVIQPCGHVLACEECMRIILTRSSILHYAKCPLCRLGIVSYGKFIIA